MSLAQIKSTAKGLIDDLSGIGTIDTARIDPDEIPRKVRGTDAYWGLSVSDITDASKSMGTADRTFFRQHEVRLEGWRGIQAANEAQATWDALAEAIVDAVEGGIATLAAGIDGFKGFGPGGPPRARIDIVRIGQSRYHHAAITFGVRVFKRIA